MEDEKWEAIKEKIQAHGKLYPYPEGFDTVIGFMLDAGDKNAGIGDVKGRMVKSLKALCKTLDNNPFSTRNSLPAVVVDSLKVIEESLIAFYENIWESNSLLFPIIEPPHGKSKIEVFESRDQWVEVKLVAYRKKLVAYYNSGMWDGTLSEE
tara:strand:- start:31 stop:486 length:456 start_codon:yes stop_codon:yes gene_type:complete